jgi:hypothetical protein
VSDRLLKVGGTCKVSAASSERQRVSAGNKRAFHPLRAEKLDYGTNKMIQNAILFLNSLNTSVSTIILKYKDLTDHGGAKRTHRSIKIRGHSRQDKTGAPVPDI